MKKYKKGDVVITNLPNTLNICTNMYQALLNDDTNLARYYLIKITGYNSSGYKGIYFTINKNLLGVHAIGNLSFKSFEGRSRLISNKDCKNIMLHIHTHKPDMFKTCTMYFDIKLSNVIKKHG